MVGGCVILCLHYRIPNKKFNIILKWIIIYFFFLQNLDKTCIFGYHQLSINEQLPPWRVTEIHYYWQHNNFEIFFKIKLYILTEWVLSTMYTIQFNWATFNHAFVFCCCFGLVWFGLGFGLTIGWNSSNSVVFNVFLGIEEHLSS